MQMDLLFPDDEAPTSSFDTFGDCGCHNLLQGLPAQHHYRRSKTNKAPRKRTFIMHMTKYAKDLMDCMAASKGVMSLQGGDDAVAITSGATDNKPAAQADCSAFRARVCSSLVPVALAGATVTYCMAAVLNTALAAAVTSVNTGRQAPPQPSPSSSLAPAAAPSLPAAAAATSRKDTRDAAVLMSPPVSPLPPPPPASLPANTSFMDLTSTPDQNPPLLASSSSRKRTSPFEAAFLEASQSAGLDALLDDSPLPSPANIPGSLGASTPPLLLDSPNASQVPGIAVPSNSLAHAGYAMGGGGLGSHFIARSRLLTGNSVAAYSAGCLGNQGSSPLLAASLSVAALSLTSQTSGTPPATASPWGGSLAPALTGRSSMFRQGSELAAAAAAPHGGTTVPPGGALESVPGQDVLPSMLSTQSEALDDASTPLFLSAPPSMLGLNLLVPPSCLPSENPSPGWKGAGAFVPPATARWSRVDRTAGGGDGVGGGRDRGDVVMQALMAAAGGGVSTGAGAPAGSVRPPLPSSVFVHHHHVMEHQPLRPGAAPRPDELVDPLQRADSMPIPCSAPMPLSDCPVNTRRTPFNLPVIRTLPSLKQLTCGGISAASPAMALDAFGSIAAATADVLVSSSPTLAMLASGGGGGCVVGSSPGTGVRGGFITLQSTLQLPLAAVTPSMLACVGGSERAAVHHTSEVITCRKLISAGAYGDVYRARWGSRTVAAKLLKVPKPGDELSVSDVLNSFRVEAAIQSRLDHPHITRLLHVQLHEGPPTIVLQYAPWGTLSEYLHLEAPRPWLQLEDLVLARLAHRIGSEVPEPLLLPLAPARGGAPAGGTGRQAPPAQRGGRTGAGGSATGGGAPSVSSPDALRRRIVLLALLRDVADALLHLAQLPNGAVVTHRDVKLENVLISTEGTAKLTDFGVAQMRVPTGAGPLHMPPARRAGSNTAATATPATSAGGSGCRSVSMATSGTLTLTSSSSPAASCCSVMETLIGVEGLHGTAQYAAPEDVWRPSSGGTTPQIGSAADVFSFGVCLWECLSGQRPWHGVETAAVIYNVGHLGLRLPVDIRWCPRLVSLMQACWHSAPEARPRAAEVVEALDLEIATLWALMM